MGKLLNYATMRRKPGKLCLILKKLASNSHVQFFSYSAVVQLLANSLSKVDIDLRNTLYNEIVLAGGNTMMDGFPERFIK